MNKVSIEQLINMNMVRYDRLKDIINSAFVGSNADSLNIFIDMYSLLKPIYAYDTEIQDYSVITSCIINICAHYRAFFKTRYQTNTKFFIVYSENCGYLNKQFYPDYNSKNEYKFRTNKMMADVIKFNIKLLDLICPYLPDIYFVHGTFETSVIMYDIICRNEAQNNYDPNMIITKDMYNYQLVPARSNNIILRPYKDKEDKSFHIDNNNLLNTYLSQKKIKYRPRDILFPGVLSLIMTLSSIPERNIKSLFNITSAIKMLESAISDHKIFNGHNSDMKNVFNSLYNNKWKIGFESFEFRYKATDLIYQYGIYMVSPESTTITFKQLSDPNTIKEINNRYFIKYPLDLERL